MSTPIQILADKAALTYIASQGPYDFYRCDHLHPIYNSPVVEVYKKTELQGAFLFLPMPMSLFNKVIHSYIEESSFRPLRALPGFIELERHPALQPFK